MTCSKSIGSDIRSTNHFFYQFVIAEDYHLYLDTYEELDTNFGSILFKAKVYFKKLNCI